MIRTSIVCDKCGAMGFSESGLHREKATQMRRELRGVGWLIGAWYLPVKMRGEDYCPECKTWAINKAKEKK